MKRKLLFITFGLLLLGLLVWALMPSPVEVETASVTEGRFERSIQEDGRTRLRERFVVSMPQTGRLARIELKQGDSVLQGAALATMWPTAPQMLDERARAEQMARIEALKAMTIRANVNIQKAQTSLAQARSDFKRSEMLTQQGFTSANQNESVALNVNLREQDLQSAQQDAKAAGYELAQASAALKNFSPSPQGQEQAAYKIAAPVAGRVLKILQTSEGVVMAGTPLLELGDPTQLEVVVDILTQDAAQIQPGTPVQLANWGGPTVLTGKVRLVEPAAFTKISALGVEEQRVNSIIDITTPAQQWTTLGDGFKVDVRVLVQVTEKAVQVPVSALFPIGARSALFVLEQGHARQREIEVLARNGADAWIKSDLPVGTLVIVYPDRKLKDGDAVKPR